MYIKAIRIYNVRSIKKLSWSISGPASNMPGWHVIIGDNGSGKSTLVRSVALALVGPGEASALRQDWNDWLSLGSPNGFIQLFMDYDQNLDKFSGKGPLITSSYLPARLNFVRNGNIVELRGPKGKMRYLWGGNKGWFSASYGPFRRFTGGDKDFEKIYYSNPKLAPHLSAFGESVALSECLEWLQSLQFKKLEKLSEGDLLDSIKVFINQEEFLPHQARLEEVSSKGVEFVDGNGNSMPVDELSDGYRSILSMTFELIRQLSKTYYLNQIFSEDSTKIVAPGVVIIDEVDAHLHPTWQRKIGLWFREHFPNIQFIVTTHSPLVCQAANVGSVWRLPIPGGEDTGGQVTGQDLDRLLYGNILDAYGTEMFGDDISRSDESKKMSQRLAELNQKQTKDGLSNIEEEEQQKLRAIFSSTPHTVNN